MAKIDSHLPERVSELLATANAKASELFTAYLAFIMQFLSAIPPFLSRHASGVNSHVREHVLPVVQPHCDRISAEASVRLAPYAAWAQKNISPTYKALQKQFEEQTDEFSHLQIAAAAGLGCLLVYWLFSKLVSWLVSEPDQPASQRRATFLRSLPGVRGVVERERAKVCFILLCSFALVSVLAHSCMPTYVYQRVSGPFTIAVQSAVTTEQSV
jgi:hypothetical protein